MSTLARRLTTIIATALGMTVPVACLAAAAADYPTRPIQLILPYAAGGGGDTVMRLIAQRLSTQLGQQVLVLNRPGANGNLGTDLAAKSKPDGYTILLGTVGPLAVNVSLYQTLPFDPVRDFEPISLVSDSFQALVVHPSIPVKTVREFIAFAKTRPGKLNYGTSAVGSAGHLAGELFNTMAGVKVVHVPYKGGALALIDLLGGQIEVMYATMLTTLPHLKTGKIRGIAVSSATRAPMAPDLPTIAEAGLRGYEAANWYGLVAPAKTPQPIITRLNQEIVQALETKEMKDAFFDLALRVFPSTPEQFRAYIKSEIAKWGPVVKRIGLRAD